MGRSWRQTAFPLLFGPRIFDGGAEHSLVSVSVRRDPLIFDFLRSNLFVRTRAQNRGAATPDGKRDA
jgi:hypothetical protein